MRRWPLILPLLVLAIALATPAPAAYNPALLARISLQVFGSRAPIARCIAHYESTDGAYLYNGPNLGPWQINVAVHTWVDARRVVTDWWYAARVAYRLSSLRDRSGRPVLGTGGRDWRAWSTHRLCGV